MIQVSAPEHLPLVGFHLKGAYHLKKKKHPTPPKEATHTHERLITRTSVHTIYGCSQRHPSQREKRQENFSEPGTRAEFGSATLSQVGGERENTAHVGDEGE